MIGIYQMLVQIEAELREFDDLKIRYAEGLDAWSANNRYHAAEIVRLRSDLEDAWHSLHAEKCGVEVDGCVSLGGSKHCWCPRPESIRGAFDNPAIVMASTSFPHDGDGREVEA